MGELPAAFGKYFLTEKIATGGMAEIYLAKLLGPGGFEKQLVIKQIHPRLSGQRHFVELFVTEAKTLVSLTHGNIVPVYELGVVDQTYFIAMEYIDGPTLFRLGSAMRNADAIVDPSIVAHLGCELLKGLDYAHRKGEGVVHRDLSPRNVMLSRDGEVKLVDFGIAVAAQQAAPVDAESEPVGSFPYMSPEQVRREPLGAQSDLFSCSVLLWELLTGEALFARPTPEATLEAVTGGAIPSPSALQPGIPPRLEEIILRGLERDRSRRWGNAADYLAALSRFLYAQDPLPTPVDVGRLVARHCPPIVNREPEGGVTKVRATELAIAPGADAGDAWLDRTRPVDRPPSHGARGTPRAQTEQSFATNVAFERVLANATPLFPIRALTDDEAMAAVLAAETAGLAEPGAPTPAPRPRNGSHPPMTARSSAPDVAVEPEPIAAATRPGRRRLIAAAAALVIGIGVVVALRTWPRAGSATAPIDAATAAVGLDAAATPARDAGISIAMDAGASAEVTLDAAVAATADGGRPVRRPDAGGRPPAADGGARATSAQLRVGADPWGEVELAGRRLGRAPGQWSVTPGKHVVIVTFPVPEHEQTRRFEIDVRAGETTPVFADFTP